MRTWQWIISLLKILYDFLDLIDKLINIKNKLQKNELQTISVMLSLFILLGLIFPFQNGCWSDQEKCHHQHIVYFVET